MPRLRQALFVCCSCWVAMMRLGGTIRMRCGALAFGGVSWSTPHHSRQYDRSARRSHSATSSSDGDASAFPSQGKLLVLGGTGFLGQAVCHRAARVGYGVTSLSRRGNPPPDPTIAAKPSADKINYRQGDARRREDIANILNEGGYVGLVHCVGLLLDGESGLGQLNRFASGSGSVPDDDSTYDAITRATAFNAIDAVKDYCSRHGEEKSFPFCFVSAAEAGWPDVAGGSLIESAAPDFLKRYLKAKRQVEAELLRSDPTIRPVIFRPSLVYSMDRPASYAPVGAFFVGNAVGLPFIDRPVTVQSLAAAIVRSVSMPLVKGVQRYQDVDKLSL